jgi:hypothetical protein
MSLQYGSLLKLWCAFKDISDKAYIQEDSSHYGKCVNMNLLEQADV